MNSEDVSKVLENIESTSGYVKNLAGSAWDVMVTGTSIEGFVGLACIVFVFAAVLAIANRIINSVSEYDKTEATVIAGSLVVLISYPLLLMAYDNAIKAFAPEYAILKALIF